MNTRNFSGALIAVGLLMAVPAFAQTTPQKQPTQEGGTSSMPLPATQPFNADPNYKQRTQEGGNWILSARVACSQVQHTHMSFTRGTCQVLRTFLDSVHERRWHCNRRNAEFCCGVKPRLNGPPA